MERTCKVCGFVGMHNPAAKSGRARAFHGLVCWECVVAEQRAWRGTELGREEARAATIAYRQRKRAALSAAQIDAQNAINEPESRRNDDLMQTYTE